MADRFRISSQRSRKHPESTTLTLEFTYSKSRFGIPNLNTPVRVCRGHVGNKSRNRSKPRVNFRLLLEPSAEGLHLNPHTSFMALQCRRSVLPAWPGGIQSRIPRRPPLSLLRSPLQTLLHRTAHNIQPPPPGCRSLSTQVKSAKEHPPACGI